MADDGDVLTFDSTKGRGAWDAPGGGGGGGISADEDLVITGDGSAGVTPAEPSVTLGVETGGNNNAHMEIASPATTGIAYQDFTVVGVDTRVRQLWDEGASEYRVEMPALGHTLMADSAGLNFDDEAVPTLLGGGRRIYVASSDPADGDTADGDIWIQIP